jgi:phage shock protein C
MASTKKLTRSTNKILAGVCGGIAEYFEIDPTLVRILYAALSFFSAAFPGLILYIIMLLIMPPAGTGNDKNDNIPDAEVVE